MLKNHFTLVTMYLILNGAIYSHVFSWPWLNVLLFALGQSSLLGLERGRLHFLMQKVMNIRFN